VKGIYFDNAATSPVRGEVQEAMNRCMSETFGNASSLHLFGQAAKRALEGARTTVARCLGADAREIYFTSGGTESDNLAIRGVAYANRDKGRHIITSPIEHHAVLNTCLALEREGFEVTYAPVDRYGVIDLDAVKDALRPDTILITVMLANNEVGTVEPITEISALARERGILVHTDAVQGIGKLPVNVDALGVDLLALTAHKFYGPKGQGALYVRKGTKIAPLFLGGHHEGGLRPGTENVPGIVGLATALRLAVQDLDGETTRTQSAPAQVGRLRDRLEDGISGRVAEVFPNGHPTRRVPNISNLSFAGVEGESLLLALDMKGIAVSTGSACNAGATEPSHVLRAMGLDWTLAQGSLRFSLGRTNTESEVDYAIDAVTEVVERLRQVSPLYRQLAC
jgi:cysteine desulfurase